MNSVKILNIEINNVSLRELLINIRNGGTVVTPNVDHLVKLQKDPDFYHVYSNAEYIVCDSQILLWASKLLGNSIQEKISGSDLFPQFYQHYKQDENIKIFLLGGAEGVANRARQRINAKVGRQMVVGAYSPSFGFEKDPAECQQIVDLINQSGATVLAIGVGAPKQEKWIDRYKEKLENIKIFLAVGATIDFEAGCVKRAPGWISQMGLEWFYRLICEPKRLWRRYLVESLPFFWLVMRQKLNLYAYKKPIGLLLRQAGLLSPEQVATVVSQQAKSQQRFGDLVVQQGWLKQETVDFFADELTKLIEKPRQQPIGQYLRAAALLDESRIARILEEQQQDKRRFGEIAVSKGWLAPRTVDFFLALASSTSELEVEQQHLKPKINVAMLGPSLEEKGGMGAVETLIINSTPAPIEIQHASTWDGEQSTLKLFSKALVFLLRQSIVGKVDLVHIHLAERGSALRKSLLALIAFVCRKPIIMHAHGCEFHVFHAKLPKGIKYGLNWVLQHCTYLLVLSESWKNFYVNECGVGAEQVIVLPNPVVMPEQVRARAQSDTLNFLFLGKINQRKGVFDLLKAFAQLARDRTNVKLILAGSGEIEQARKLARSLNIEGQVSFPGWVNLEQRNELLTQADVFLLPSYNEGLPMALLEAMSWQLPAVTTPVGGIPEVITHRETGLLVDPGDVKQLAAAMQSLISDDSLRRSLGRKARRRVAPLNIDQYSHQMVKIYYSALGIEQIEKSDVISSFHQLGRSGNLLVRN